MKCNKQRNTTLKSDDDDDRYKEFMSKYLTEENEENAMDLIICTSFHHSYLLDILPGAGNCWRTLSSHCIGPFR